MRFIIKTILSVLVINFFFSQFVFGLEKVELLPVTPLPIKDSARILTGEYRDPMKARADGKGRISRLGKKEIVINDSLWVLANSVLIVSKSSGLSVSRKSLRTGQMVEFVLNKERKISALRVFDK